VGGGGTSESIARVGGEQPRQGVQIGGSNAWATKRRKVKRMHVNPTNAMQQTKSLGQKSTYMHLLATQQWVFAAKPENNQIFAFTR
jgi:hypothetical protein